MSEVNRKQKLLAAYVVNLSVVRHRKKGNSSYSLEASLTQASLAGIDRLDLWEPIFNSFVTSNTGITATAGLTNGEQFSQIEGAIGSGYFNSLSATAKGVYSVFTTAALVGSFASNSSSSELCAFYSGAFPTLNSYLGQGPTGAYLTTGQISTMLSTYDLSGALTSIFDSTQKSEEASKIYFRYYDLTNSFGSSLNINTVRDSAILEYGVSGELSYSPIEFSSSLPECEELEIPIFAYGNTKYPAGVFNMGPINFPCVDPHTFKKPVTGAGFSRDFVDGPYSSGLWNKDYCDRFINREKSGLHFSQYQDNKRALQTFSSSPMTQVGAAGSVGWIQTYLPFGEYVTPFVREKNDSPANDQITKFHIGNASGRIGSHISGYVRSSSISPGDTNDLLEIYRAANLESSSTGIKFVPIRMMEHHWKSRLSGTTFNPHVGNRIYQLGMNFDHGFSKDLTHDQFENSGICGPPQMNELADLPYLMFYQDFDSKIDNTYASIRVGFAQSAMEKNTYFGPVHTFTQYMMATTGSGGYSPIFKDNTHHRASDYPQASVSFSLTVPSTELENTGLPGGLIKHNFFGMGNNLDGGRVTGTYRVINGGILFSGRLYSGVSGIEMETGDSARFPNLVLISGYSGYPATRVSSNFCQDNEYGPVEFGSVYSLGCTLGSSSLYDYILEGWGHPSKGVVKVSKMYAYDGSPSGSDTKEFTYSGFSSGNTFKAANQFPLISASDGFAANPYTTGLLSSGWIPFIKKQRRANFAPRYWRGPYAAGQKKFLYPNAADLKTGTSYYGELTSTLKESVNEGSNDFYSSQLEKMPTPYHQGSGFSKGVGFPYYVVFDLKVEEYATKEFFKTLSWNSIGNTSTSSIVNVDPITPNVTWKKVNSTIKTNCVDSGYAGEISVGPGSIVTMGHTGKNPLVYNSPPNFVHGFINDSIGYLSGESSLVSGSLPTELISDTGAYLVRWQDTLSGSNYGDSKTKNPEGNYFKYKTYSRTITGVYVPPGYRMQDGTFHPEYALRAWPNQELLGTSNIQQYGWYGVDPLYYKRVGGLAAISGVPFTISEQYHGGNHPNHLRGDSWMALSHATITGSDLQEYGYGYHLEPLNIYTYYHRNPERDWEVILADIRATGFGVHLTASHYFPATGRHGYNQVHDTHDYYKSGFYTGFSNGNKFDLNNKVYSFIQGFSTGMLFRLPSGNGWSGVTSGDNVVFPNVQEWHRTHTGLAYFYRQASRMDLTFTNLRWSGYGQPPSDIDYLYQPSGTCTITGKMVYNRLREAPVFSEGLFLADITQGDPIKTYGSYPQYVSDVLKDHGEKITIPLNSSLEAAPSRQLELIGTNNVTIKEDGSDFRKINTTERDFNKFRVIANSDYTYLNKGVLPSYEDVPIPDDLTFPRATMLYSANQGQPFPDNTKNPLCEKAYEVQLQFQYYDGELTDAAQDHRFRTNKTPVWSYKEPSDGKFIPANVTIREAELGLY
jgi:hypothetical protein